MAKNGRRIKGKTRKNKRKVSIARDASSSTDGETLVWSFDKIDKNGDFRFVCGRSDMDHRDLLYYIIQYSARKWGKIKLDTHDDGKSKHHFLNYDSLCSKAQDRIKFMNIDDDAIYSLALTNRLRVIGLRDGRVFRAIWYDPNHEFCPVEY